MSGDEPYIKGISPRRTDGWDMGVPGMAEQLDEMTRDLRQAVDLGADLQRLLSRIHASWERFGAVLDEIESDR
jgi:hypothetical protein